jgi:hypothetical protein
MKRRFMDIKDKKIISNEKHCPSHYLPHKIPFGEKISDEPCHFHYKKWRMMHHKPFCKFIVKCPHYEFMIKEYNKRKNENP